MTVAFDAFSDNNANDTADFSWTHTPVGTPRGIVVMIIQNQVSGDEVIGVTYGGIAMAELTPDSPLNHTLGSEDGVLHAFFLGSGIPPGAQTVAVDVNATGSQKRAGAVSVTASSDIEVEDTVTGENTNNTTDHEIILSTAASLETFILGFIHSGATTANLVPPADCTEMAERTFNAAQSIDWVRKTANPTGGAVSVHWTTGINEESGMFGIALKESASQTALAMVI